MGFTILNEQAKKLARIFNLAVRNGQIAMDCHLRKCSQHICMRRTVYLQKHSIKQKQQSQ